MLRVRRRLHFQQIGRMQLAAVGANGALAEQRIVGRASSSSARRPPCRRPRSSRHHRLKVVRDAGIDAGLHHGREFTRGATFRLPALWSRRGWRRSCPVPGSVRVRPLRRRQSERIDVAANTSRPAKFLPGLDDAEFGARLDRVDVSPPAFAQADDLWPWRLALAAGTTKVVY